MGGYGGGGGIDSHTQMKMSHTATVVLPLLDVFSGAKKHISESLSIGRQTNLQH